MASLCSESSRSYLGRSVRVPVSRAGPKGGATGGNFASCAQKSAAVVIPSLPDQGRREGPNVSHKEEPSMTSNRPTTEHQLDLSRTEATGTSHAPELQTEKSASAAVEKPALSMNSEL